MTVVGIHPEDLLDKLARSELSEQERAHLDGHLQGCSACRLELELRADFALEAAALNGTHAASHLIPAGAVSRPRRRGARRGLWATGLAAIVVVSGAVAAPLARGWQADAPSPAGMVRVVPSLKAAAQSNGRMRVISAAPVSAPPIVTPPPQPAAVAPAAARPHSPRAVTEPVRAPAQPAAATPAESAGTLFAAANRARRRGDIALATELYRTLQKRFAGSPEADLSLVTMATLQLDNGNTTAALATFDAYLSRGGKPLEAEALVGRAMGLRRLGRLAEEAEVWRVVLRRYPGTAHAERAKERLRKLSAR